MFADRVPVISRTSLMEMSPAESAAIATLPEKVRQVAMLAASLGPDIVVVPAIEHSETVSTFVEAALFGYAG